MKRRTFLTAATTTADATIATASLSSCSDSLLKSGEILHTVIFDLTHPVGSEQAEKFLADGYAILTKIAGVRDFQVFRQCSPKNDFQYGFFMRFSSRTDFDAYTAHPDHARFVTERWDTEVSRFQESDFQTR